MFIPLLTSALIAAAPAGGKSGIDEAIRRECSRGSWEVTAALDWLVAAPNPWSEVSPRSRLELAEKIASCACTSDGARDEALCNRATSLKAAVAAFASDEAKRGPMFAARSASARECAVRLRSTETGTPADLARVSTCALPFGRCAEAVAMTDFVNRADRATIVMTSCVESYCPTLGVDGPKLCRAFLEQPHAANPAEAPAVDQQALLAAIFELELAPDAAATLISAFTDKWSTQFAPGIPEKPRKADLKKLRAAVAKLEAQKDADPKALSRALFQLTEADKVAPKEAIARWTKLRAVLGPDAANDRHHVSLHLAAEAARMNDAAAEAEYLAQALAAAKEFADEQARHAEHAAFMCSGAMCIERAKVLLGLQTERGPAPQVFSLLPRPDIISAAKGYLARACETNAAVCAEANALSAQAKP